MTNKMANITRKGRILAWGDLPFMTAALRLEVVSEALHRLFQAHETTYTEPLNNLCGGTAAPVHRHCGTRASALWHPCIGDVTPVHRQCGTRASAMRHPCIGDVHPANRYCLTRTLAFICHLSHICCHTKTALYKGVFSDCDK